MKPLEYCFSLDFQKENSQVFCQVRNGDDCSKLIVSLREDGEAYMFDSDVHVFFLAKKSDGNSLYTECSVVNNTIVYEFTEQTAPVSGSVICQFLLLSGSNRLTTPMFRLEVSDNVSIDPDSPQSLPEYTALIDATQDAIDATDDMRDLIDEIEYKLAHGEFKGEQGEQGEQGNPGADGFSPTATVTKSGHTATITITDKNGTTTAEISDGDTAFVNVQLVGSSVYPNIDTATAPNRFYIVFDGSSFHGLLRFSGNVSTGNTAKSVSQIMYTKTGELLKRIGTTSYGAVTWTGDWTPIASEGSDVTIINAETVPESASWGDEIPYTYVGEYGDVAFWNGELWYLSAINEYGEQKTYAWERLLSLFDLEELENAINAKMSLAPLNPTAEQIAAMAGGQLYGDKIAQDEYDEALAFKLPQGFYYEGVLKFFSAHTSDSRYPRVYRSQMRPLIESIDFSPKVGSFWLYYTTDDSVQSLYVLSHNGGSGSSQYWRKLNNHINVVSSLPVSDPMPYKTNYSYDISGREIPPYDVNDEIIVSANGQVALYKCLGYNKVYDSSLGGYKAVYNWQEKSRIYTKTEIDQKGFLTLETLPIYDGTVI